MSDDLSIEEQDEIWTRVAGQTFQVRVYRPAGEGPFPAILDVHGGAWTVGDRTNGVLFNRALASRGFLVAAIDFRDGPNFKHPAASLDVANAIRWLRINAERLSADVSKLGLIGSSSGGHLALHAAITPHATADESAVLFQDKAEVKEFADTSADVSFVIALWPVSDPFFRYRYAKRAKLDRLVSAHDGYFETEDAMRQASVSRIIASGEAGTLPPAMIVQPGEDSNVPVEMTFELLRAWQSRGGYIEYAYFPEQPHAFGHHPCESTSAMVKGIIDFAVRQVD
ncbi:MAG: acetyl esterase [Candidatus Azotimanducaceae bacterium]